jgi:hypothetical protein
MVYSRATTSAMALRPEGLAAGFLPLEEDIADDGCI